MNDKSHFSKDEIDMLNKLLQTYEQCEKNTVLFLFEEIVEYEYSILESEKIIDLYNFRLSGSAYKSPSIIDLVEKIKNNNEPKIIMHDLKLKDNRKIMIYTNINCDKMIDILPLGSKGIQ